MKKTAKPGGAGAADPRREAQRRRVVQTAHELFRRHGSRKVSMDDLARELSLSKKTLYLHFEGKEALMRAVIERLRLPLFDLFAGWRRSRESVEARIAAFQRGFVNLTGQVSAEFLRDLKIEFPHLWDEIDERRRELLGAFEALYEEGVRDGSVNADINPRVVVAIHLAVMERVMHPDAFARGEFTPAEVAATLNALMRHGLFAAGRRKPAGKAAKAKTPNGKDKEHRR